MVRQVAWARYDCDDDDITLLALSTEADPTLFYSDDDGDGYGDNDPSSSERDAGAVAGTDCDDSTSWWGSSGAYTYPGAGFENEADPTLCMEDADEDGYGAQTASWNSFESGTDCDDSDAAVHPGVDGDADGAERM